MTSAKGIIVKEYLDKWGNEIGSLTLAKKIYAENPLCFNDVEDVRDKIRYYRGNKGDKERKKLKDERYLRN